MNSATKGVYYLNSDCSGSPDYRVSIEEARRLRREDGAWSINHGRDIRIPVKGAEISEQAEPPFVNPNDSANISPATSGRAIDRTRDYVPERILMKTDRLKPYPVAAVESWIAVYTGPPLEV